MEAFPFFVKGKDYNKKHMTIFLSMNLQIKKRVFICFTGLRSWMVSGWIDGKIISIFQKN